MDPVTHGLASFALARACFPRASRVTIAGAVLAGAAADLDHLSEYFGPSAFLSYYRGSAHSIIAALILAAILALISQLFARDQDGKAPITPVLGLFLLASLLHVAMDLFQNQGVKLLWPFRSQKYSLDSVAHLDLWILLFLLAGVLLPRLLALVTEEIGAKSKAPRGRIGAGLALLAACLYFAGRFVLHGNAAALLESRTYRGELPRKVAAFAESDSPFHWRGMVETERAIRDLDLDMAHSSSFNPDSAVVSYKPEASPALDAARNTEAALRFLSTARFPKASLERTSTGFRVEIRDFAFQREARPARSVMAVVQTDPGGTVLSDELIWDPLSK
jgi:inner membrane protein